MRRLFGSAHGFELVVQSIHSRVSLVRSLVSTLGSFIWSIADQLRGPYRPNQYGNVILPLTILRRLDCILEPDRETVRALAAKPGCTDPDESVGGS
ncbi:type I restriction-modification system subunit M N-terminal domain-containing protein [Rhodococcus ruber]|nr:type I restriction-modification system subunit M N-terminal domain-containing protein [Rhodococcus ruber]MCD2130079.1 type I restriction-modification system subunit M N-terminal domain-containing protein [Rhodococcus ruber]